MNLLGGYVLDNDSIYDILNATTDEELMKGVAESYMEFSGTKEIILYTSLNITNTNLLKQGKYTKPIIAFEYYESTLDEKSEFTIKISYDIKGLYDTLHPRAYQEIDDMIKKNKLKKSEIKDMQIVRQLLKSYTGVRVHSINPSMKCYTKTHIFFEDSKIAYILNPTNIKILDIIKK